MSIITYCSTLGYIPSPLLWSTFHCAWLCIKQRQQIISRAFHLSITLCFCRCISRNILSNSFSSLSFPEILLQGKKLTENHIISFSRRGHYTKATFLGTRPQRITATDVIRCVHAPLQYIILKCWRWIWGRRLQGVLVPYSHRSTHTHTHTRAHTHTHTHTHTNHSTCGVV